MYFYIPVCVLCIWRYWLDLWYVQNIINATVNNISVNTSGTIVPLKIHNKNTGILNILLYINARFAN